MKSLSEIFGQERAVATLRAAMASGRVHHAWIFHGPQGVGKFTTAKAFAAAVLDPSTAPTLSGEIAPDPGSETQRLIAAGAHPDLHVVTKELALVSREPQVRQRKQTNIPKEVLLEFLIEPAGLASQSRSGAMATKVFIIDEADFIEPVGQNALLKTLEEPPAGTVIILVTSAIEDLLPTIRSRCQRVAFEPIDDASMRAWLDAWLKAERATAELEGEGKKSKAAKARLEMLSPSKADREWALSYAAGSPGLAALAIEGGFGAWARDLDPLLESAERGVYDPKLGSTMAKLVGDWAEAWVDARKNASKDAANKAGVRHLLALVAERARRRLRTAAGLEGEAGRALAAIDLIADAERQIDANVNMSLAFENLAVRLTTTAARASDAEMMPVAGREF